MTEKDALPIKAIHEWMQAMLVQHVPISNSGAAIADMVNDSQRLNAAQHLTIYRQSYIARLRSCMKNQFRCLNHALGESLFEAFADQYLDENPSVSYTLNDLGEKFPGFLEKTRPDSENGEKEDWPDFMIELAAFEYKLSLIFDMQEGTPIDSPDVDTPDDLLIAAPAFRLFEHEFPICRYYMDFNAGLSPELPFPQKSYCAVARKNYRLGLFSLGIDQYTFLKHLGSGSSVTEAKNKLIADFGFDSANLDHVWPIWRKNFIASGFFIRK